MNPENLFLLSGLTTGLYGLFPVIGLDSSRAELASRISLAVGLAGIFASSYWAIFQRMGWL